MPKLHRLSPRRGPPQHRACPYAPRQSIAFRITSPSHHHPRMPNRRANGPLQTVLGAKQSGLHSPPQRQTSLHRRRKTVSFASLQSAKTRRATTGSPAQPTTSDFTDMHRVHLHDPSTALLTLNFSNVVPFMLFYIPHSLTDWTWIGPKQKEITSGIATRVFGGTRKTRSIVIVVFEFCIFMLT